MGQSTLEVPRLCDALANRSTLTVLGSAMVHPDTNPYASPMPSPAGGTLRRAFSSRAVFWTVAIATFLVLAILPGFLPPRDGSSSPSDTTSLETLVSVIYFLDGPMRRAGYGADQYQLPVNIATACFWSFALAWVASRGLRTIAVWRRVEEYP